MTQEITLATLAERFRRFNNFSKPEPESHQIWYLDRSSVGNRYKNWQGIWARREVDADEKTIDLAEVYKKISYGSCDWWHLFYGIHFGLIVGPKTLAAVEECLDILRNDTPPADDGTKVLHTNRLGGTNWLTKPVYHDWNLTDRLGEIMSKAFFADRAEENLYSPDYKFVYKSHSGWNRSC